MLPPKSAKEIKQFLGLAGYYHKFVPRFSDLSRPLTRLTQKDVLFEWIKECQAVYQMLKDTLCEHPILRYLDPAKSYILFMDASKHAWAGVLTQPYDKIDESTSSPTGKKITRTINHPITYVSGLF